MIRHYDLVLLYHIKWAWATLAYPLAYAAQNKPTPDWEAIRKESWDTCGRLTRTERYSMFRRCLSAANIVCLRELASRMGGTLSEIVMEGSKLWRGHSYRGRRREDGDDVYGIRMFDGGDDDTCLLILDEFLNKGLFPEFWDQVHVSLEIILQRRCELFRKIVDAGLFRISPFSPLALKYMMIMIEDGTPDMELAGYVMRKFPRTWLPVCFGSGVMSESSLQYQLMALAIAVDPIFTITYWREDESAREEYRTLEEATDACIKYIRDHDDEGYTNNLPSLVTFHRTKSKTMWNMPLRSTCNFNVWYERVDET